MKRTDTFMGESFTSDSSNISEAAEMAGFGKYLYPQSKQVNTVVPPMQTVVFPGGYGYNTNGNPSGVNTSSYYGQGYGQPQQQQYYGGNPYYYQQPQPQPIYGGYQQQPMLPPPGGDQQQQQYYGNPYYQPQQQAQYFGPQYGLGANPYMYGQQQQQSYYPGGNPLLQSMNPFSEAYYNNLYKTTIDIPPVRHGGEYLFDIGEVDAIGDLMIQLVAEDMRRCETDELYNNAFYDNHRRMLDIVNRAIESEKEKARDRRKEYEMNLSRVAHKFAKDGVTEEQIEEAYTGKTIPNPFIRNRDDIEFEMKQERFRNLVPVDTSAKYRAYDAQVTAFYNSIIPKDTQLKDLGSKLVEIQNIFDLNEEYHRRIRMNTYRTGKSTDSYRYCMQRRIIAERAAANRVAPDFTNIQVPNYLDSSVAKRIIDNDGKINLKSLRDEVENNIIPKNSILQAHIADDGTVEIGGSFEKFMQMKASGEISQEELDALDNPVLDPSDYEEYMNPPASINKYTDNNEGKYGEDRDNFIRFANSVYVQDYDPVIHDTHRMKGNVSEYSLSPPKADTRDIIGGG